MATLVHGCTHRPHYRVSSCVRAVYSPFARTHAHHNMHTKLTSERKHKASNKPRTVHVEGTACQTEYSFHQCLVSIYMPKAGLQRTQTRSAVAHSRAAGQPRSRR
eukprot:2787776-Prymnesium_polylepis.1